MGTQILFTGGGPKQGFRCCFAEWLDQSSVAQYYRARSIQPKIPEISVRNSMDRFGPAGKNSKNLVNLSRWTTSPGRTDLIEKWPVHSTTPTHSHSQCACLTVRYILGVYPSKNGGFSLLVQLLWHNCTQPGTFAIPPVSSYCR